MTTDNDMKERNIAYYMDIKHIAQHFRQIMKERNAKPETEREIIQQITFDVWCELNQNSS